MISFIFFSCVGATNYYVNATTGNNASDGLTPGTAWKTIGKVNAATFYPGDNIYFERGETWREKLTYGLRPDSGNSSDFVTFSVYGSGAKPIINGADLITNWTDEGGNIWSNISSITSDPNVVWLDGISYLEATSPTTVNITNRWYWNSIDNKTYIYATSDPSSFYPTVEIPYSTMASLFWNNDYVKFENLHFKYGRTAVLAIQGDSDSNLINNCTIEGGGGSNAFQIQGTSNNNVVDGCTIKGLNKATGTDAAWIGCDGSDCANNNTIRNCNISRGSHTALKLQNVANNTVEYNEIWSADGYGRGAEIAGELGIGGNVFRYNYVHDTHYKEGFSDGSNSFTGEGNQIYYNIFETEDIHNIDMADYKEGGVGAQYYAKDNLVYNNILYNSGEGGIEISLNDAPSTGNIFRNNIIIENDDTNNYQIYYNPSAPEGLTKAIFDNNIIYDSNTASTIFNGTDANTVAYMEEHHSTYFLNNIVLDPSFISSSPSNVSDFFLNWNSSSIDAGTNLNLTADYSNNPIYGTPDIGAYEYQPPYNSSVDKINYSSVRVYGDGKYRRIASSSSITGANFTINSIGSDNKSLFIDINITTWNTSGTYYKNWTEDGSTSENVSHTIAELKANSYFTVKVDSVAGKNITGANCTNGLCLSDADGKITFNYTGGYSSHVFEVVDATSPTITFSCTPTSVRLGQTITCSCTAMDSVDSSPSVLFTTNPLTSSKGTFTTTCTATDDAGNSATSSISYSVSLRSGGGSSSGGSGSSYTNTIIKDDKEFSEIKTITRELKKKERVRIKIDNQEHHIGVAELTNTTATIEIFSTSQKTVFNINDENKFEVTGDNYYDIYVKLNSIVNDKANLTITSIYEEIIAECEEPVIDDIAEIIEDVEEKDLTWLLVVIGLIVLIVIAGVIVMAKRKKR